MKNFIAVGLVLLVVLLAANSLFVVRETERAVMLRFGELVNADIEPGLHVKMPWINTVRKFDARIQTEDSTPRRYLTLEQKALEVDSYAKWRIQDVGQFYVSTRGNVLTAGALLAERINDGLRDQIGARNLQEVVAGERDLPSSGGKRGVGGSLRGIGKFSVDLVGKVWNTPNTAIGLAWGAVGAVAETVMLPFAGKWDYSIGFANNALEFRNHPLMFGAITLGNTIAYASDFGPGFKLPEGTVGDHERQHTYQGQLLGPLYLPSNILESVQ